MTVFHYDDVIMTAVASQITSLMIVYSIVYSGAYQRKHQSSASLAFVWGIHRDRWIPRTKGQLRGKCFHLMTPSCIMQMLSSAMRSRSGPIFYLWLHKVLRLYKCNIFSHWLSHCSTMNIKRTLARFGREMKTCLIFRICIRSIRENLRLRLWKKRVQMYL